MTWTSGIDNFINKFNPMKQPMQWLTDNTIGKIPGNVGRLGSQTYDYSNSHPLESLGAMAAAYYGASALGGGALAGGEAAGGAGAGAGAGAGDLGLGLGTTSGFGGVGTDAAATGFGSWGAGAGGADVGGLAAADSAAVDAEGAAPGLTGSYGPSSSFNWQGMARQALSKGMGQGQKASGGQQAWQPTPLNGSMSNGYVAPSYVSPQQTMARMLMLNGDGQQPGALGGSMNTAMLASQLLKNNQSSQTPGF
jgi:hypothetical protein